MAQRRQNAWVILGGWLPAAALLWLWGCGFDARRPSIVHVVDGQGVPVEAFVAVLWTPDGRTGRVVCPQDTAAALSGLSCEPGGGLRVVHPPAGAHLTVKARGFSFETRPVSALPEGTSDWVLKKLDAFVSNDDYATGFAGDAGGLQDFVAKGYSSRTELGAAVVVKFYIDNLRTSPVVYFQNTLRHPIHYDFVRSVLGKAISSADFVRETYQGSDRSAMAGSVVYYPKLSARTRLSAEDTRAPLVVTFFPSDDLTPAQAARAHRLIEERLGFAQLSGASLRTVYLPAGDIQEEQAISRRAELEREDAAWVTRAELYGGISMQLLNEGIAYGTLLRMTPEEMARTPVSFTDVLVLTRLPNDLPVVGGTITEELQTPLAHVNVAARNRGTPNMALLGASEDARVAPFLGKLVRFEVRGGTFSLREATLQEAQEFWNSHHGEVQTPDADLEYAELADFEMLAFGDSVRVGVKAANLAQLRQLLPDATSRGFAVPFRYYHEFTLAARVQADMCAQAHAACASSGRDGGACDVAYALCLRLAAQPVSLDAYLRGMIADADFRTDAVLRDAALDGVRFFFLQNPVDPEFGSRLDARVEEIFGAAKVRLRSSTNAEDLPNFSGAGLYSSHSAYASGERAASRAIRRTWASVWNREAFEERAFWNIDHMAVKMGVAVNMAFENESANGVVITQNIADLSVEGMYVNVQLGEISVTNPENGALPEIFSIIRGPAGSVQTALLRYSSLSPDAPILTPDEIRVLFAACNTAHDHFAWLYGQDPTAFALDIEFKFWGNPRRLYLKQARPYAVSR